MKLEINHTFLRVRAINHCNGLWNKVVNSSPGFISKTMPQNVGLDSVYLHSREKYFSPMQNL